MKKIWKKRFLAEIIIKALIVLAAALIIFTLFMITGLAAPDETDKQPEGYPVTVTVEDITAVMDQLDGMETEIDMLARLIHSEAGIVRSRMEQAAVVWCVLNRVDAEHRGETIADVITAESQFAWNPRASITEELRELARDVVTRWLLEQRGVADVLRTDAAKLIHRHIGHGKSLLFQRVQGV